jgi:hypothetical protein
MYQLSVYEEAPSEPVAPAEYSTLRAARAEVRRRNGGKLPRVDHRLSGEVYDDGQRHIEAYYTDDDKSSGWWITATTHA